MSDDGKRIALVERALDLLERNNKLIAEALEILGRNAHNGSCDHYGCKGYAQCQNEAAHNGPYDALAGYKLMPTGTDKGVMAVCERHDGEISALIVNSLSEPPLLADLAVMAGEHESEHHAAHKPHGFDTDTPGGNCTVCKGPVTAQPHYETLSDVSRETCEGGC